MQNDDDNDSHIGFAIPGVCIANRGAAAPIAAAEAES